MSMIKKGVYIVINPAEDRDKIIKQILKIKNENIAAIQIWDNPKLKVIDSDLLRFIVSTFKNKVPVLINNKWKLLKDYNLDGIHFDKLPNNLDEIEKELEKGFIKGITLGNDLSLIPKIKNHAFDYLSFCSMFPSSTVSNCTIVSKEIVKRCSELIDIPIFLSGGINLENVSKLNELNIHGIALVTGIMHATDPKAVLYKYISKLNLK